MSDMLKIRLQRVGRKAEPVFRLVLTDSKNSTKSGKFLEILGNFDSRHAETSSFKAERITHWIGKGAQVSDTVHNLLIDKKIITGKKVNVLPLKKPIIKSEESVKVESVKEDTGEAKKEKKETLAGEAVVEEAPKEETPVEETPVAETAA